MKIFVLNCGSSSVKYKLYDMGTETVLADGKVERIGQENAQIVHQSMNHGKTEKTMPIYEHTVAISESLNLLVDSEVGVISSLDEITGVGHRVLHGGEYFKKSVLVTDKELALMDELRELGPLHMPANITGIRACQRSCQVHPRSLSSIQHFIPPCQNVLTFMLSRINYMSNIEFENMDSTVQAINILPVE